MTIAFKSFKVEQILSVRPQGRTMTLVDGDRVAQEQTQLRKRKCCLRVRVVPQQNGEFTSFIYSLHLVRGAEDTELDTAAGGTHSQAGGRDKPIKQLRLYAKDQHQRHWRCWKGNLI